MSFDRYVKQQQIQQKKTTQVVNPSGTPQNNKFETNTLYLESSRRGDQFSDHSRPTREGNIHGMGTSVSVKPMIH